VAERVVASAAVADSTGARFWRKPLKTNGVPNTIAMSPFEFLDANYSPAKNKLTVIIPPDFLAPMIFLNRPSTGLKRLFR
jgi:hypothetical protein